jgi:hypothetical protein
MAVIRHGDVVGRPCHSRTRRVLARGSVFIEGWGRIGGGTVAKYACRQPVEALDDRLGEPAVGPFLPCMRDAERQNVAARDAGWFWRFLQASSLRFLRLGASTGREVRLGASQSI